jgi:hypothetical protein
MQNIPLRYIQRILRVAGSFNRKQWGTMFIRKVLGLILFLVAAAVQADENSISPVERDAALAAIKKWRSFEGAWVGEVQYVAAPDPEWLKGIQPIKITFDGKIPKAYVRVGEHDWSELGSKYGVSQTDELTVVIHAYGSGGVWTENNVIVLTRRSENEAVVYIQRVVNNWAGTARLGEDRVYGDTRFGKVERK